ncbi:ATP-binding protein [Streptomyces sp. NPDC002935]|uniref:ATP-binding protein n=1 Tax=unclassified Streptomyces TaxID=2593676 RepID=UPI0033266D79
MSRHEPRPENHDDYTAPWTAPQLFLGGLPEEVPELELVKFRVRLFGMLGDLIRRYRPAPFAISAGYGQPLTHASPSGPPPGATGTTPQASPGAALAPEERTPGFSTVEPLYTFEQLVLPEATADRLLDCVSLVEVAPLVFDTWNLRSIEPNPSTAVNFRGPPGTGKTMAAHAIAHRLGRRMLSCRLSDLESKYHGDGPKNLAALFATAKEQNAVLFIDEAESLLSRRFAQPQQAAESAINSMRTELLMALDIFTGLVIFASNLPHSYDAAIESRLMHVDFALPDRLARRQIWQTHLPAELPVRDDVSIDQLADVADVSGRDIKLAVILAAIGTARRKLDSVSQDTLLSALEEQRAPAGVAPDGAAAPDPSTTTAELSEADSESVAERLRHALGGQRAATAKEGTDDREDTADTAGEPG